MSGTGPQSPQERAVIAEMQERARRRPPVAPPLDSVYAEGASPASRRSLSDFGSSRAASSRGASPVDAAAHATRGIGRILGATRAVVPRRAVRIDATLRNIHAEFPEVDAAAVARLLVMFGGRKKAVVQRLKEVYRKGEGEEGDGEGDGKRKSPSGRRRFARMRRRLSSDDERMAEVLPEFAQGPASVEDSVARPATHKRTHSVGSMAPISLEPNAYAQQHRRENADRIGRHTRFPSESDVGRGWPTAQTSTEFPYVALGGRDGPTLTGKHRGGRNRGSNEATARGSDTSSNVPSPPRGGSPQPLAVALGADTHLSISSTASSTNTGPTELQILQQQQQPQQHAHHKSIRKHVRTVRDAASRGRKRMRSPRPEEIPPASRQDEGQEGERDARRDSQERDSQRSSLSSSMQTTVETEERGGSTDVGEEDATGYVSEDAEEVKAEGYHYGAAGDTEATSGSRHRGSDAEGQEANAMTSMSVHSSVREVMEQLATTELAYVELQRASAVRERKLVNAIKQIRHAIQDFDAGQQRRYDLLQETFNENYRSVGQVDARVDEMFSRLVQYDRARQNQLRNRVGMLILDGLAYVGIFLLWTVTTLYHFFVRQHRVIARARARRHTAALLRTGRHQPEDPQMRPGTDPGDKD